MVWAGRVENGGAPRVTQTQKKWGSKSGGSKGGGSKGGVVWLCGCVVVWLCGCVVVCGSVFVCVFVLCEWVLVSRFPVGFHVWVLVSRFWSCSVPPDRPSRDSISPGPPKISLFSNVLPFLLSLGGLFVECSWCLKHREAQMCAFGVLHQNSTRRTNFEVGVGKQKSEILGGPGEGRSEGTEHDQTN